VALQAEQSPWVGNDVFDPDILSSGAGKALRLFSKSDKVGAGSGLIGYWNVRSHDGKVDDSVAAQDIWEVIGPSNVDRSFALRSHLTERVYTIKVAANQGPSNLQLPVMAIQLDHFEFDIVSVSLVKDGIAVLGLVDKFNSLAGIASSARNRDGYRVELKCCGILGIFVEDSGRSRPSISLGLTSALPLHKAKLGSAMGHVKGSVMMVEIEETFSSLVVNLGLQ